MTHWYLYLDESGRFMDGRGGRSDMASVVAGVIAPTPLPNERVIPVLRRLFKLAPFDMSFRDLHALELRDKLTAEQYADWMVAALRALDDLGSKKQPAQAIIFRNSESVGDDNPESVYLTVLVEGVCRLLPRLLHEQDDRLRLDICLENRRVMGHAFAQPQDGAVTRTYVSIEEYASRLRTRLALEITRQGLRGRFHPDRDLRIRISDPATDKALNFADFICHHSRYRHKGLDQKVWEEGIAPRLMRDIPLVFNLSYDSALELIAEGRLGDALFSMKALEGDLGDPRLMQDLAGKLLVALHKLSGPAVEELIDTYLGRVAHLERTTADGLATIEGFLDSLATVCKTAGISRGGSHGNTVTIRAREDSRSRAFAFGQFRAKLAMIDVHLARGEWVAAEKLCREVGERLGHYARSQARQPWVWTALLQQATLDSRCHRFAEGSQRLDHLVDFQRTIESWLGLTLPSLVPGLPEELSRDEVDCEVLGLALKLRGELWTHWAFWHEAQADVHPFDGETRPTTAAALDELMEAAKEFRFPEFRFQVALQRLASATLGHPAAGWEAMWEVADVPRALRKKPLTKKTATAVLQGVRDCPWPLQAWATLVNWVLNVAADPQEGAALAPLWEAMSADLAILSDHHPDPETSIEAVIRAEVNAASLQIASGRGTACIPHTERALSLIDSLPNEGRHGFAGLACLAHLLEGIARYGPGKKEQKKVANVIDALTDRAQAATDFLSRHDATKPLADSLRTLLRAIGKTAQPGNAAFWQGSDPQVVSKILWQCWML